MSWFKDSPLEKQIDTYNEHLQVKQEQFDELEGVDTAAAKTEREQLRNEIAEINIHLEQTRDQLTQEEGQNFFMD